MKVVHRLVQRTRVDKAVNQPNERRVEVWLCVKTCLFINALEEPFWLVDLPSLECLDGALMVQGALRKRVVVGGRVGVERLDLALDLRLQALELRDLVAAQAPVESRSRDRAGLMNARMTASR